MSGGVLHSRVPNDAVERLILKAQHRGSLQFTVVVEYNSIEIRARSTLDGASDKDLDPVRVQTAVDAMREAGLAICRRLITDEEKEKRR